MSICEYSLRRDSTRQLSPSFKVREFGCKGSDVVLLDEELVVLLQCIREHFGKPLHITSGYLTAAHNAAGGLGRRLRRDPAAHPGRHRTLPEGCCPPEAPHRLGAHRHPCG